MKDIYIIIFVLPLFVLGQTQQEIDKKLNEISNKMNKSCPMVIDECTTMLNTFGGMGKVRYNIQIDTDCLTDYDNIGEWIIYQNYSMTNSFCTDPSFKSFREMDVTMVWTYYDLFGNWTGKVELNNKDCK